MGFVCLFLLYWFCLVLSIRDCGGGRLCQHTAAHCNTLQHTATHCNTLQHTATRYKGCSNITRYCILCIASYGVAMMSRCLEIIGFFANEPYETDYILQKRAMILRSPLIVATPYCLPWNAAILRGIAFFAMHGMPPLNFLHSLHGKAFQGNHSSLLQNIVSFAGLFCKKNL